MEYEVYVSYYNPPWIPNGEDKFLFNFNDTFWNWEKINHSFNWESEISGNINLENNGKTPTYLVLKNTTTNKNSVYIFTQQSKLTNNIINWELTLDIFSTHSKTIFDNNISLDLIQYHYDYRHDTYFLRNYSVGLDNYFNVTWKKEMLYNKNNDTMLNFLNKLKNNKTPILHINQKNSLTRYIKPISFIGDITNNPFSQSNYKYSGNLYYLFKFTNVNEIVALPILSKDKLLDVKIQCGSFVTNEISNNTIELEKLREAIPHNFIGVYNFTNFWELMRDNNTTIITFERDIQFYTCFFSFTIPFEGREINFTPNNYVFNPFNWDNTNVYNNTYAFNSYTWQWYYRIINIFNYDTKIIDSDFKLYVNFSNGIKIYEKNNIASNGGLLIDYGMGIDYADTNYLQELKENKRAWTMGLYSIGLPKYTQERGQKVTNNTKISWKRGKNGVTSRTTKQTYSILPGKTKFNPLNTFRDILSNTVKLEQNNEDSYWNAQKTRDIDSNLIDLISFNFYSEDNLNTNTTNSVFVYQTFDINNVIKTIWYLNYYGVEKEGIISLNNYLEKLTSFGYVKCEGGLIEKEIFKVVEDTFNIKTMLVNMFEQGIRIWKFPPINGVNNYKNNWSNY